MKTLSRFTLGSTLVVVLATVGVGATAFAQNAPPTAPGACQGHGGHGGRGGHGRGAMDPARFIQRLDRNGDGRVQVSELPPRMAERMGAADANRDGVISAEELTAHRDAQRAARFARMDTNGDGALTPAELQAHMAQRRAARQAQ